ncbi:MAG: beta-lactamase class D [Thalassolituus oleivorans]|jgi:beta-lactamase class D
MALAVLAGLNVAQAQEAAVQPAETLKEEPAFARHFVRADVVGTFVLYNPAEASYRVHDAQRASQRFIPASTFKIPNTLIALETGAVLSVDEKLPWDGEERWYDAWNQDHSMRTGFPVSAVWLYQELARRIGDETMSRMLRSFGYGNAQTSGGVDRFWLDGGLRISAVEQVQFLQMLHEGRLPISSGNLAQFEDIAIESQSSDHTLRSKTGWAVLDGPDIGWYVGYVESKGEAQYLALNIDMDGQADAPARVAIAHGILEAAGLLGGD